MIISRTPLRMSFFGGGTDYPDWFMQHGGKALSCSIDKYIYVALKELPPFFDHSFRITYSKIEHVKDVNAIGHPAIRAVFKHRSIKEGLELHISSDLPARSGLGSSSAFVVGLTKALNTFLDKERSQLEIAEEAIFVEQELLKEHVGVQDQMAVSIGGLNVLEFQKGGALKYSPLSLNPKRLSEFENHFCLFFIGKTRISSTVAKKQIDNITKNTASLLRFSSYVEQATELLRHSSGIGDFGRLLDEAWHVKRELANGISNAEIDAIYSAGIESGAYGGKLLGAGGGGFILFLCPPEKQPQLQSNLAGLVHVPTKIEFSGTSTIYKSN